MNRKLVLSALCAVAMACTTAAGAQDISRKASEAEKLLAQGKVAEAIAALDDAAAALWDKAPLSFRRALWVAEKATGFGAFNPRENAAYASGAPMMVYAEPVGFGWRQSGEIWRTDLIADLTIKTADGNAAVPAERLPEARIRRAACAIASSCSISPTRSAAFRKASICWRPRCAIRSAARKAASRCRSPSAERARLSRRNGCDTRAALPMSSDANPTGSKRACRAGWRIADRRRSRRRGACSSRSATVYELYGFEPVETPAIEYTDALGKFLPDQDRPNEGVFSFQDDDEQWLSLRYDLTAPLARYVAENFDTLAKPYRSYRHGWVFRNEKPGPGRFREFMQFDADTVGSASPAADAEICMMAADTMERLGIARGDYVVKINSRKVLDGVLEAIGLGGEANAGKRLTVLRAIDKLDRLGAGGVRALLGRRAQGRERRFHQRGGTWAATKSSACWPSPRRRARARRRRWPTSPRSSRARRRDCDGVDELRQIAALVVRVRLWRRSHPDRSVGRARPRILHRAGLRGGAHLRDARTTTAARCGSARSAAAGAMTAWSRASAASRCRRPDFPSACRACSRR